MVHKAAVRQLNVYDPTPPPCLQRLLHHPSAHTMLGSAGFAALQTVLERYRRQLRGQRRLLARQTQQHQTLASRVTTAPLAMGGR